MGRIWAVALLLFAAAAEFSKQEIASARACLRISMQFEGKHSSAISEVKLAKPHLDPNQLENIIQVDMFENCRKTITAEDVEHVKTSQGQFEWKRLGKYLTYDTSRYNTQSDLIVPDEHIAIRKVLFKSERGEL